MQTRVYPNGEIEVVETGGGTPHFEVLAPGSFDAAAALGVSDIAAATWTPQVIADYEAMMAANAAQRAAEAA